MRVQSQHPREVNAAGDRQAVCVFDRLLPECEFCFRSVNFGFTAGAFLFKRDDQVVHLLGGILSDFGVGVQSVCFQQVEVSLGNFEKCPIDCRQFG